MTAEWSALIEGIDFSTVSGLLGALIGGATSLGTTWLTTTREARAARIAADRARRDVLYGKFIDELSTLYANALKSEALDLTLLSSAYAVRGRITLMASAEVVDAADRALKFIVDLTVQAASSDLEVRAMMDDAQRDVITDFARACRTELATVV